MRWTGSRSEKRTAETRRTRRGAEEGIWWEAFGLGTFFLVPNLLLLVQVVVSVVSFDLRARAEERLLTRAFGDQYRRYMARTARVLPGIY